MKHQIEKRLSPDYPLKSMKKMKFQLVLDGEPDNYVRERYTSNGNRFYNKKGKEMKLLKKQALELLEKEKSFSVMKELLEEKDNLYYVSISAIFYLPTGISGSKTMRTLKNQGILKPAKIPDIDNFSKFLLDSMHGVFYDNDSRVIELNSKKLYSEEPRTELSVTIEYLEN